MKLSKVISKITIALVLISMSVFLFAGCKSKDNSVQASGKTQGRGNFDPAAMKTRYEDALKGLVTDKTITQDQSDKVLVAMTKSMPSTGTKPTDKTATNKTATNKQANAGQGSGQNKQRPNQLAELVTSKVITQAQADIITEKLRGNFQQPKTN